MNEKIIVNKRNIGTIDREKKSFRKYVRKSLHLMRMYNAWGIDSQTFSNELLPENFTIEVHEQEEGKIYLIKADKFYEHSKYYPGRNTASDDLKWQIFCDIRYWDVVNPNQQKLL
jgi:hypothetical protein